MANHQASTNGKSCGKIHTMSDTIETTIDNSGRLVVPKAVREAAGIRPGMALRVRCRNGLVELEPVPRDVQLVRRGKVSVVVPDEQSEPLTDATVRATQRALRKRHGGN